MPSEPGMTLKDRAMDYIREHGVVQMREFAHVGVPSIILRRLVKDGLLLNPGRGVYVLTEYGDDPLLPYAVEVASAPQGSVVCLLTAAHLHGLITRDPRELWLAIPPRTWAPKPIGLVPMTTQVWPELADGFAATRGSDPVADIRISGRNFCVTSPARTVSDLFANRQTFGMETAVEALGKAISTGVAISDIEAHAAAVGLGHEMAPYLAGAGASLNVAW